MRSWPTVAAATALAAAAALGGCSLHGDETPPIVSHGPKIDVTSTAFAEGQRIPTRFTCDGEDVPPPLSWRGVPAGAQHVAVVVDDPDAPGGTFVHWTVLLSAKATSVPADLGGYHGPCPPRGSVHHYRFSVYALERTPALDPDAIRAAATASGTLTGTYSRP